MRFGEQQDQGLVSNLGDAANTDVCVPVRTRVRVYMWVNVREPMRVRVCACKRVIHMCEWACGRVCS